MKPRGPGLKFPDRVPRDTANLRLVVAFGEEHAETQRDHDRLDGQGEGKDRNLRCLGTELDERDRGTHQHKQTEADERAKEQAAALLPKRAVVSLRLGLTATFPPVEHAEDPHLLAVGRIRRHLEQVTDAPSVARLGPDDSRPPT